MRNIKWNRIVQSGTAALLFLLAVTTSHAWWGNGPWSGYGYGPGYGTPNYGHPFSGYVPPPMPYGYVPALPGPTPPGAVPYPRPGAVTEQAESRSCGETNGETGNNNCPEADAPPAAPAARSESPAAGRYYCRSLNGVLRCWYY